MPHGQVQVADWTAADWAPLVFGPVVMHADGDRQGGLDRGAVEAGLALDADKGQVAADYQQAASRRTAMVLCAFPVRLP